MNQDGPNVNTDPITASRIVSLFQVASRVLKSNVNILSIHSFINLDI